MLILMAEKELENWKKIRQKGAVNYIIKTSLITYAIVFSIYFVSNAIRLRDRLDYYFNHFFSRLDFYGVLSVITVLILAVFAYLIWVMNEKRYQKTVNINA